MIVTGAPRACRSIESDDATTLIPHAMQLLRDGSRKAMFSTIKGRLALAMTLLSALLIIIGLVGQVGMGRSNTVTRDLFASQMPAAVSVGNAEMYMARERLGFDRAALNVGTPAADDAIDRGALMRKTSDDAWARYAALPQEPGEKAVADKFNDQRLALQRLLDRGYADVRAKVQANITADASAMQSAFTEFAKTGIELRKMQFEQAQVAYDAGQAQFSMFRTMSIVAILVGVASAFYTWFSLRSRIMRPLDAALGQFGAIAAGDLRNSVRVTSKDEMGELLRGLATMQSSLIDTVRSVRLGSESIVTATRQIAAGNMDLSSRTEEQASALQQTASSMDQLTGTVKQNADNARQASVLAANASEIAGKGSSVVSQVVATMRRDQPELGPDCGYHCHHRRYRIPDQYSRAQRCC